MVTERAKRLERRLARLAARQHGVVSLEQLQALGLSADLVRQRVHAERLHGIHRAVYAVGHAKLSNEGRWSAAVLAYGGETVLSHRSAAELWGLLHARRGPVDVTVPGVSGRRGREGIRLHRSTTLTQQQSTRRAGIPVTTPARTLSDLRSIASPDELSRARRQAEFLGYRTEAADPKPVELARTELERRFLRLCRRHLLPSPEVDARIGACAADFLWRPQRLVVETDGHAAHSGRESIEYDRRREARLAAAGYEILRFTWHQVLHEPAEVIAALRARLAHARGDADPSR